MKPLFKVFFSLAFLIILLYFFILAQRPGFPVGGSGPLGPEDVGSEDYAVPVSDAPPAVRGVLNDDSSDDAVSASSTSTIYGLNGSADFLIFLNISGRTPYEGEVYSRAVKLGDFKDGYLLVKKRHLNPGFLSFHFPLGDTYYGFSCWLSEADIVGAGYFECFVPRQDLYKFFFVFGVPGRLLCDGQEMGVADETGVVTIFMDGLRDCYYQFYPKMHGGERYVGFYLNETPRRTNTFMMPVNFSDLSIWGE